MLRPRKMKLIEFTVLKNDVDTVLEYLGKRRAIHFPESNVQTDSPNVNKIKSIIDKLISASVYMGIDINNPQFENEDSSVCLPSKEDEELAEKICSIVNNYKNNQLKFEQEKLQVYEALNEAQAFSKLNVPFSELDQLSYLTLRIGRLDQKGQSELREYIGDRAVIIPLDNSGKKILAASSKKGRFTLDSHLKKVSFEPIAIPQDYKGVPSEMIKSLEDRLSRLDDEIRKINSEKEYFRNERADEIKRLLLLWNTALEIAMIKCRFTSTDSLYHFSGWIPADNVSEITEKLMELTEKRIAIKAYSPDEVAAVNDGSEKVPVYMKHGAFVKGFEGVVFSYGAPLYGTIDPTPLVAFFFTLLFGIMFGDVGHGFVLFLAGILILKGPKALARFSNFSTPLISIGLSSMFFGLLFGAVFSNEILLVGPTRAVTGAVTGNPVDRLVPIMPLEETGGSLAKLLYFFGFTIAIGAILISIGLLLNIVNHIILKKYEQAFFSKTGLAGLFIFWYALFIALRVILGGHFVMADLAGLFIPVLCIFFGPLIWRLIARERPLLEHGLIAFIMEGFVEILETLSTYISNTISFLRVGAFALSHTILSFIVFTFYAKLAGSSVAGSIGAVLIMIIGNVIIIVLEGMIVAIQVVRLQYYEFFNKFFVETGVEFSPFRFNSRKIKG